MLIYFNITERKTSPNLYFICMDRSSNKFVHQPTIRQLRYTNHSPHPIAFNANDTKEKKETPWSKHCSSLDQGMMTLCYTLYSVQCLHQYTTMVTPGPFVLMLFPTHLTSPGSSWPTLTFPYPTAHTDTALSEGLSLNTQYPTEGISTLVK